jgi:hypothetical protein
MDVLTRSYDAARTGTNTQETNLTPQKVGNNLLIRQVSLHINDDPRIEAQPLYVSGVDIGGKRHDVVMADSALRLISKTGREALDIENDSRQGVEVEPRGIGGKRTA